MEKMNGFAVYTIQQGESRMSFVPEKGGTAFSLKFKDRELLYCHENFWDETYDDLIGGWPFIFPICARIARNDHYGQYLYNGQCYELPIHGFAPYLPWEVVAYETDRITLELAFTPETLKVYPFKFRVRLNYLITETQLFCHQEYYNLGKNPLPFYAGFHPYFAVTNKNKSFLNCHPTKLLQYNEQLTDIIGTKPLFHLPVALSTPEINENLLQLSEDNLIQIEFSDGLHLSMQDESHLFNYLQLYHIPEKSFFCVEPWMAFPNAMNTVEGVTWLAPDSMIEAKLRIDVK